MYEQDGTQIMIVNNCNGKLVWFNREYYKDSFKVVISESGTFVKGKLMTKRKAMNKRRNVINYAI